MREPVEDTPFLSLFILCDLSKDVILKRKIIQWIMVKSENCAILLPKSFMVIVIFECNNIFNPIPLELWEKSWGKMSCLSVQKNGFYGCRLGVWDSF